MKKLLAILLSLSLLCAGSSIGFAASGYSVVCSPQYNMAETFESSVTKVSKNTKWALANSTGEAITGYEWEAMGDITSEYIPAKKNGLWGYITTNGSVLIPYRYAMAGYFKNGIAMVQTTDNAYAYIDIYGNILFLSPFTYSFSPSDGAICGMVDNLYGYCDTQGNMIIHPQFEMAFDFHEGYAAVKFGSKWGYITTYGAYSVRPTYDYASDFKNGRAICRLGSKYGIINTSGVTTSAFVFDYIGTADNDGRYPAKSGAVSGYINANGEWLLKTSYDFCYTYTDGVARVYQDGKWGLINEQGAELISPTFADLGEYHNGLAPYSMDGYVWGYLTLTSLNPQPAPVIPEPVIPDPEPVIPDPEPVVPEKTEPTHPSVPITPPVIENPSANGTHPLDPKEERCISMRIGSTVVLKGADETTLAIPPALVNGTTMIPVRDIVELLGGNISWVAADQRINITYNYNKISMIIGKQVCSINGVPDFLSAAPIISEGYTLVPLRDVSDALGCKVEWDGIYQNIYIYY